MRVMPVKEEWAGWEITTAGAVSFLEFSFVENHLCSPMDRQILLEVENGAGRLS